MAELAYQLVDVFTQVPFGGNQLAVFTQPEGISGETMQLIARELNLSETVFILLPTDSHNHYRLRIFTPAAELPFAGHPTIGASFVIHQSGMIPRGETLRLEEGVGLIEVGFTHEGDKLLATMHQPMPQFQAIYSDRQKMSAALSLDESDLLPNLPIQIVSSGMGFLFIPIKSLDAIKRIRVRGDLYEQIINEIGARGFYVFTTETEREGSHVHSRLFAPNMGIVEDPATGSAGGPLGAYLLRYGLVDAAKAKHLINEQGFEMKRPSLIHIHIDGTAEAISSVTVGGYTQPVGKGVLSLMD